MAGLCEDGNEPLGSLKARSLHKRRSLSAAAPSERKSRLTARRKGTHYALCIMARPSGVQLEKLVTVLPSIRNMRKPNHASENSVNTDLELVARIAAACHVIKNTRRIVEKVRQNLDADVILALKLVTGTLSYCCEVKK
ncbi:hypothetical protein ANN_17203 [Periplaneta americana]|uniref:Uncharacterized protein n=1 Tax=Periplaneta americana TaxID=6978 RepID=A0ABQ8SSA2_PERAM|nr:hypothetical protein ANN_17203 [Periplaneta americana]